MGRDATNDPPFTGENRNAQGRIFLRRCSRLDKNDTNDQTAQRSHQFGHAGFSFVINLINVSKRRKIRVKRDRNAVIVDCSP